MITLFCIRPKGHNIGNDAIHFALRAQAQAAFGRIVNIIDMPATTKYESHSRGGLSAKSVYEINRYGDGVIIGGGNLFENGELEVAPAALRALEPPLMLYSLSRGRVYNRNLELVDRTDVMSDELIRSLEDKAVVTLVRDPATEGYMKRIGCPDVIMGGCPTIHLDQMSHQLPTLPAGENPGVLISIRTPALMNVPLRMQARVQGQIEEAIDELRDLGYKRIRVLCHDARDVDFATVFQSTRNVDYVFTSDVWWFLSLIRSAELVVSYRLHATLPALSFGRPVVSMSYDERAMCLLNAAGLGDWDINLVTDTPFREHLRDRLNRLDRLVARRDDLRGTWERWWEVQSHQMERFARRVEEYARHAHAILRDETG